jgi:hypothetical protein
VPNLSLRGLDATTLSRIRSLARRQRTSVNKLIVATLRHQYAPHDRHFDDLDALAGAWSKAEAAEFESAVAPFAAVEAALWAAQPKAAYSVKARGKRRVRR